MDADKIILPDFLIADLYKETLVDIDNFKETAGRDTVSLGKDGNGGTTDKTDLEYYGKNEKNIVILVTHLSPGILPKDDMTFLSNILKACQLTSKDIAIMNINKQEVTFDKIKEQLNARHILLFELEPSLIGLPFKIPFFQIQNYAGCTIMLTPALTSLNKHSQEGRLLKTKLWNSLQQFFDIT